MPRTKWIVSLIAAVITPFAGASVITGSPPGGSVTLHNGSFPIDLNGDGVTDITISDQPVIYGNSLVAGSMIRSPQGPNIGVYRGGSVGESAIAFHVGETVGPSDGSNFLYSVPGLAADAVIHMYSTSSPSGAGDPAWIDGQHHFAGIDVLSGTDHHYGWLDMSLHDSAVPSTGQPWYDVTIYGWAYETQPNQTITIPEPSATSVFSLFSIGALGLRRRRSARELARRVAKPRSGNVA